MKVKINGQELEAREGKLSWNCASDRIFPFRTCAIILLSAARAPAGCAWWN